MEHFLGQKIKNSKSAILVIDPVEYFMDKK